MHESPDVPSYPASHGCVRPARRRGGPRVPLRRRRYPCRTFKLSPRAGARHGRRSCRRDRLPARNRSSVARSPGVETMRAIRKRESGPGLVLDEVPVPTPGEDEVLVRIEAASRSAEPTCTSNSWDEWASERVQPPLTLGHELCGTVVRREARVRDVVEGDYVSAESHVTCGVCFHCRTGQAHMCEQTQILGVDRDGAFAEYVAVPRVGDLAQRPREASARDRDAPGAVRQRRLRDQHARSRRQDGGASSAAGRSGCSASRSRGASGPGALLASDRVPFRARPRAARWAPRSREHRRGRRRARLVRRAQRGRARRTSSSRCPARRTRSGTRSGSSGTAATSSCSGSLPGPSRSTSRSR